MPRADVRSAAAEILDLLAGGAGSSYFGEAVTQLDHALQAADLARRSGADDETVIAAMLHDVGHLLEHEPSRVSEVGVVHHDVLGSEFLWERGFSSRVVQLVRGHVAAKRYLTATNSSYYERLSEASKCTLALQGGPMSSAELADFERSELRAELLRLRSWDEQAKVPRASVAQLEDYRPLIHTHLTRSIL